MMNAKADAAQTKQMQHENAQLLKMITKIQKEGGRVSTRWDDVFLAGW